MCNNDIGTCNDSSVQACTLSGNECVVPHIDVTLYYQPIVVYIGREFAPGQWTTGQYDMTVTMT